MIRLVTILLVLAYSSGMAQTIAGFTGLDVKTDKDFSLSEYKYSKAIIVIFNSNKCAYSDYYLERIKSLITEYNGNEIRFVMVNSNNSDFVPEESKKGMKEFLAKHKLSIPYISDKDKKIKALLKATRTPEVVLLKPILDRFQIVYQGAIDDNPQSESDVNHAYLKESLLSLLS